MQQKTFFQSWPAMPDSMKIHLIAACGTAMGALACMLKEEGHTVTGSDANVYPPMSDFLVQKGIRLLEGFDKAHVVANGVPDLVIIGNAVSKDNPEAAYVLEKGISHMSMPQAVNRFFARDKKIIMVTGTHGKTTTSSIMAHILSQAGMDPSFMIGGILKDYGSGFHRGKGDYMVIEGDEYDTAFFDKGPKFMHYDPYITIMTGIEFDHADIFTDLDHIKQVFSSLAKKIAPSCRIIACRDNETLMDVLAQDNLPFIGYSRLQKNPEDWHIVSSSISSSHKTCARIHGPSIPSETRNTNKIKEYEITTSMPGGHNLGNFLACAAAAQEIGIDPAAIQRAMTNFSGVKRRQEIRGIKRGITVMDDFAHHPTAVKETIAALKPLYREGRLIAVFEPRTNTSMRTFFQDIYPEAFTQADMVFVCQPCSKKVIPQSQRFSIETLVRDIQKAGGNAHGFASVEEILDFLPGNLQSGDLVLIMSNGGFDNIHDRLLDRI